MSHLSIFSFSPPNRIQAQAAIHGVSNPAHESVKGWDRAVSIYAEAYRDGNIRIVRPGQAQHPISVPSSPVPGVAHSAAHSALATPAHHGGHENPFSVHSSPAPTSPSPAHNGTHSNPPAILRTPAPAPAVTFTTPATGTGHHPASVQSSPAGPFTPKRPSTPAFSNHSVQSTPAPVTPHAKGRETASQARLRAIEDALEHYGARNKVDIPLPATPTSNSDTEDRLTAIEDCLNDLLTREALRASARDVSFNSERRAFLTAMFESIRHDSLARAASQGSVGHLPTAQQVNHDHTSAPPQNPAAGPSTGPGMSSATAPVAGPSTGPGTAPAASQEDSDEFNYFAGFEDEQYTEEEQARLDRLLNGESD